MHRHAFLFTACALAVLSLPALLAPAGDLAYPQARRGDQVDAYHGVEVADPYRWLEDADAEETRAWMEAQEALLASYLDPERVRRFERQIARFEETGARYTAPVHAGGRYFYTVRAPRETHAAVVSRRGLDGKPVVVLDPKTFLDDGERLGGFAVSPAGTYLTYLRLPPGSSLGDLYLLEVASGRVLAGPVDGVGNAAVAWQRDESGFFYVDYGASSHLRPGSGEARAELRFHRLAPEPGAPAPAADPVVFARPDEPSWLLSPATSSDGRFLVLSVFAGTSARNRVLYADLAAHPLDFVELAGTGEHSFRFLGSRGGRLVFYTNHGAPNGRIVAIDPRQPRPVRWREVVAEREDVLAGGSTAGGNAMALIGDRLVLLYRRASQATLRVFDLGGRLEREVPLAAGWIGSGLVGADAAPGEVWYTWNGFLEPATVYRLDLETGKARPFFRRDLPVDPADYVLEHVFYASADGTRVPLFVAHKRGLERDGENPVFMYGYGYGGWVAVPWYQPHLLAWLEMGGVYALPGIRGGGEYGDAWRDAGVRLNRQNAIDDYVAAAEHLVRERYTSPGRVVANGWSASGSLAAAAVLQRPDLFGAGLIGIPILDMLRYHHFSPVEGWTRGYGSSENPDEFRVLHGYSPYHNVRPDRCTPPILVTVGEKDPVAPPIHGYKFIAALQHRKDCPSPSLLKIVRGAGHAFGATPEQTRQTYAEEMSFLIQVLTGEPSPGIVGELSPL